MTGLHLVTGYKGTAHVTSADIGVFNAMTMGADDYVLTKGKRFEAQIVSNNAVRIYDGSLMMNGRQVNLDSGSYLDAIISNGTSGMRRHDIIAIRYEVNAESGIESVSLVVGEGTPSASTPTDPAISYPNSILDGATTHDMPLYRVVLNGLTIEKVEPLYRVLVPMADFQHGFYKQNMLINGDFQCNQRGSKTYNREGKVGYTLDMWRGYNVKVEQLNNGVKLTGVSADAQGYFTQFIQLGKLETKTYTISAMVDDKVCTFTVTPGGSAKEKDFGKFKISALTVSLWDNDLPQFNYYNNKLKINIIPVGTNTITINYVDVFEGIIAYPHVKEDPATAMMRCRRYVQGGTYFSPWMWYKTEDENVLYKCVLPYEPMAAAKPNMERCVAWMYDEQSNDIGLYDKFITDITDTNTTGSTPSIKYAFELQINTNGCVMNERCNGFKIVYILSCEHAPDGD